MKTLSVVTSPSSVISAGFIIDHKNFPLFIVTPVYNHHFFRICIVPKWCDYRQRSTVLPNQTLTSTSCKGVKKDKKHITVLLTANATETEKLKPMVIGKSAQPR